MAEAATPAIWRQRHKRVWQPLVWLCLRYTPGGYKYRGVRVFSFFVLLGDGGGDLAGLPSEGPGWWRGRSSPDHSGGLLRGGPRGHVDRPPQYNSNTLSINSINTPSLQYTRGVESVLDFIARRVQTELKVTYRDSIGVGSVQYLPLAIEIGRPTN